MALDATVGNRAKDNYSLTVDYSSIYKTTNEKQIREILGFECCLIDLLNTLNYKQITELKKSKEKYKNYTDRQLSQLRQEKSEIIKSHLKPLFEVVTYNIADDNTIAGMIMNNQTGKTETYKIELESGENVSTQLSKLIKELIELPKKSTKVNKLRKEMLILEQIEELERNNK